MIKGGYILQPRIIDSSEAAQFPPVTRELWSYLLRNVNHSRNERLNINRGQGFFQLSTIQEDLKWFSGYRKNTYSKPQLTKSLRRLRESSMVETSKATRGILITICNYDYYQDSKNYEGNDERTAKETRRKREGHTINKNDKNDKNDKIFMPDSYEIRLSNLLLSKILLRNPNHKKPDLQSWAKHIDYMIRLDNREPQQIANVINWCQGDSFEQNNILSTEKLRKRFDSLVLKMKPHTNTADNAREAKVAALLGGGK